MRVAFHWSGGKDSALALSRLLADGEVCVERLVTTVDALGAASTVHGVPVELLRAQARSIGIELQTVAMSGPGLDGYDDAMRIATCELRDQGIEAFAFGDLSASGVLAYKQRQFGPLGLEVLAPLWGMSSRECVEEFLRSGIRAVTVVVDAAVLGTGGVGVPLDRAFIDRLPADADPCGELGEYHTFVFDGPLFTAPVDFALSAPRLLEREIGTTEGPRTYRYWLATPQPAGRTNIIGRE